MQILSLCSGYGGLDIAVEKFFGAETTYWSETDSAAAKVMTARWPDASPLGDLTKLNPHELSDIDIVCAGFPCQPFSTAGLRKGMNDERAIFQYIGDIIGVLRPRVIVLENVQGILTRGGPETIGTLTHLGYDSRWLIVRASDAGAPHRRARWFCLAQPADTSSERHGGRQNPGLVAQLDRREETSTQQQQRPRQKSQHRSETDFGQYAPAINRWEHIIGRPAPPPVVDGNLSALFVEWMMGLDEGHVTDIITKRTPALRLLGNGVCPPQAMLALDLLTTSA
tara:strand:+ start:322 stop:1167 length:846 start_codon:yes stop_codon:yes gene_type:complete